MASERNLRVLADAEQSIRNTVKAREALHASGMPDFATFIGENYPDSSISFFEGDMNTFPYIEIRGSMGTWREGKLGFNDKPTLQARQGVLKIVFTDEIVRVIGDRVVWRERNGKNVQHNVGMPSRTDKEIGDRSIFPAVVDLIESERIFNPDAGFDSEPVDLSRIRERADELSGINSFLRQGIEHF